MNKISKYILYVISLIVLYVVNAFFFLHRSWVPVPSNNYIAQSEIDYLLQELNSGNLASYAIVFFDSVAIISIIYYILKMIRIGIKKTSAKSREL